MPIFQARCLKIISIHAPARGATSFCLFNALISSYFNPRSREGSDKYIAAQVGAGVDFNPRSREGSDVIIVLICKFSLHISIHAPARGATVNLESGGYVSSEFQSTLPRGERPRLTCR